MTRLVVTPVSTRRDRKAFLRLPWELYADDPNWVPPLRQNQAELVHYKRHPFYDDARCQTFIATRDGRPCGRVAAIVNDAHNRCYSERRGFFGFFETVDDPEVATGLFEAAEGWLRGQGMTDVRGPTNPSLNYECGLLVDGFDDPPFFMMTYNRPYYGRLVEACGYEKCQDMYAFWGHVDMLPELDKKLEFITKTAKERFMVRVRPLNKKRFKEDIRSFLDIYNRSLVNTWGFVPLSEREVDHMGSGLRYLLEPELALFAEVDGQPIGAVFGLLDFNGRIKQMDGRLLPFGFLKLLRRRREIDRIRLISTNVLPEYQRWGVGLVLLSGLVPKFLDWGLQEIEFSWVLETNHLSRGSLDRGGAKITKTYRLYDKRL